jgi:GTP pyrophosphokinase
MAELPLKLQEIIDRVQSYHPTADVDLVKKAYLYAAQHHEGQVRASGEDYIIHPLNVARTVAELRLDEVAIAAALLHDTIEDTQASYGEIVELFGKPVADIVQGVTKLTQMNFASREEKQAENFRKMLLAMSKDIRVILVKLADRVHNMRTLQYTSQEKRERKAQETIEIYAPLANRLGLHSLKSELEDLSFMYLNPDVYADLEKKLAAGASERRKFLEQMKALLEKEAAAAGIRAEVAGREKMKYSIHRKMVRQGVPFEQVFDLVAFRVVVDSLEQCWQVLGMVHALWKPLPGRFRDYVSLPKPNGYRSLHTTVVGPRGQQMEVQIRTVEMHDFAERGIAAHWKYKEGKVISPADEAKIRYIKQLIEELLDLNDTVKDSVELYSAIKEGLSFDEIFVFTPKGDVKNLPRGSTPVDFAFTVHSQVGYRCAGARVNGVMVPLTHQLKSGDVVEIITSTTQHPSQDWLRFLRSSSAKAKVRRVVRSEARERFIQIGKVLLEKELKKLSVSLAKVLKGGQLMDAARKLGVDNEEKVYFLIGSGKLETSELSEKLAEIMNIKVKAEEAAKPASGIWEMLKFSGRGKVVVGGQDDVVTKFGKCCMPLRGERIVGFVTRGRGITVHAADCPYVQVMDQERLVDVEWDRSGAGGQEVTIKLTSRDTPGLLTKMSQVFSDLGVNICQAIVKTSDQTAETLFKVQVKNLTQLQNIQRALQRIGGVEKVERIKGN